MSVITNAYKLGLLMVAMLPFRALAVDVVVETTDRFIIEDFTIAPGEKKTLTVKAITTIDCYSFSLSIKLPEGLNFVYDEDEESYIIPDFDRIPYTPRASAWIYEADFVGDDESSVLVTVYSPNNKKAMLAGNGAVFTFDVLADESLTGTGKIQCIEPVFAGTDYLGYYGPDTECHFVVAETVTLAQFLERGNAGSNYIIDEDMQVMLVRDDIESDRQNDGYDHHSLLMVKSIRGQAVAPFQSSLMTYVDDEGNTFEQEQVKVFGENNVMYGDGYQSNYDQNDWLMFSFYNKDESCNLISKYSVGDVIKAGFVRGCLEGQDYDELRCYMDNNYTEPVVDESKHVDNIQYNVYTPANFLKSNLNWNGVACGNKYYWMTPKHYEVADLIWAVYDSESDGFYMPQSVQTSDGHNHNDIDAEGGVSPILYPGMALGEDTPYAPSSSDLFIDKKAYQLRVVVVYVNEKDANGAPRLGKLKDFEPKTGALSSDYMIMPVSISANGSSIVTGIDAISSHNKAEIKEVHYIDVTGRKAEKPWKGVNIVETVFKDGSRTISKVRF